MVGPFGPFTVSNLMSRLGSPRRQRTAAVTLTLPPVAGCTSTGPFVFRTNTVEGALGIAAPPAHRRGHADVATRGGLHLHRPVRVPNEHGGGRADRRVPCERRRVDLFCATGNVDAAPGRECGGGEQAGRGNPNGTSAEGGGARGLLAIRTDRDCGHE